jgi:short subunit dehydrogenase-like uncharacterized protein
MAADSVRDKPFLLYGANGYTGELIAEECARRKIDVVLAGRREDAIRPLAERLSLPHRIFPLDDGAQVAREIGDFPAVLLAAGPFSKTSAPVIDACLRTGTHYTDITGELEVFESIHARDADAKSKGCVLMPGVGFDVVPTDCLAARLAEDLPGAERLMLAIHGVGSASRGTLKTMLETAHRGGAIRRDGRIARVPTAWRQRTIPFHDKPRAAMTIPWGDVSTAYYSTRIPNIEVYMAVPPRMITAARLSRPLAPLLGTGPVQRFLARRVDARAPGPSREERERGRSEIWGRVEAADGRHVEGTLTTREGYDLTVESAIECTRRIVRGEAVTGALTPSMAFGWQLVTELERCELRIPARQP